jgi:hypothetical protein
MLWRGTEKRPSFQDGFGIVLTFVSVNVKYPIAVDEIASKSRHADLGIQGDRSSEASGERASPLGPTIWGRVVGW